MDLETLGESIRKFRELKSITRETMAAELGLTVSGIGKLERGEVDVSFTRLVRITEILGVSISQVLNFDASQIINITSTTNNGPVQGHAKIDTMHIYQRDYHEKYIAKLEEEIERLKKEKQKGNLNLFPSEMAVANRLYIQKARFESFQLRFMARHRF